LVGLNSCSQRSSTTTWPIVNSDVCMLTTVWRAQ